jgi:hypothetical protein
MSDSTRTTADGGTSDALNVEDLFATDDTAISIDDEESADRTTTERTETTPGTGTVTPDAEDTTADELFAQLRDEHDDAEQAHAVDDVTDESPDDIMARADAEAEHVDQIDDSIRADEGALDDLLLTERREADGFLWVETGTDDADATEDDVAALFEADDSDGEQRAESEQTAANDDFSLADETDDSFEAGAATFDADDFGADTATFDDATEADNPESGDVAETSDEAAPADRAETDDAAVETDDAAVETDDAAAEVEDAAAEAEDDSDGLAARIRSILTR